MSTVKRISDSYSILGTNGNTLVTIGNTSTSPANLTVSGTANISGQLLQAGIQVLNETQSDSRYAQLGSTNTFSTSQIINGNLTVSGNVVASLTASSTNALNSATTTIIVNTSPAPITGQVLTATSNVSAVWQTPFVQSVTIGGNVSAPGLALVTNASSGIYETTGNGLGIAFGSSKYVNIDSTMFSVGAQTTSSSYTLVEVSGGPFSVGTANYTNAGILSPLSYYYIVGNNLTGVSDLYYINSSSGVPQLITAGASPYTMNPMATYSPDGKFLYFMDGNYYLDQYSQDVSSGALTLIGRISIGTSGFNNISISPNGQYVYLTFTSVYSPFPSNLYVYSRNTTTGVIGGLVQTVSNIMTNGLQIIAAASNQAVYVQNAANLYVFSSNVSSGVLSLSSTTPLAHSPYVTNQGGSLVTPDGLFFYYSELVTGNIIGYSINQTTGNLTLLPGSPFAAGLSTYGAALTLSPNGDYIYTAPPPQETTPFITSLTRNITTGNIAPTGVVHYTGTGYSLSPVGVTKDSLHILTILQNLGELDVLATATAIASPLLTATYGTNGMNGTLQVSGYEVISGGLTANTITASSTISGPGTGLTGTASGLTVGTATVASTITTVASTTNGNYYPTFVSTTGNVAVMIDTGSMMYNPGTHTLTLNSLSSSTLNVSGNYNLSSILLFSPTKPTIASGFGTTPTIVHGNGTAAFQINVGTGGTAVNGNLTMPAGAPNGWSVTCNYAGSSVNMNTYAVSTSTTAVTLTNQTSTTGASVAWPSSTILNCTAVAY